MMIFKKAVPRRAFLRGIGATMSLPLLDAMVPALGAARQNPAIKPGMRLGFCYFPNGAIPTKWTPKGEGAAFELSPILEPLTSFRDSLLVLSGLDNREALGTPGEIGGEHARACAAFLTCVHPHMTTVTGNFGHYDPYVGESIDQIAAKEFGKLTELASLELGTESMAAVGSCDSDSCLYNSTISWRDAKTPLPVAINPRAIFERLFGDSATTSPAVRFARMREKRSLLDFIAQDVARLQTELGPKDRDKLSQYLDATRDVERRIQRAEEQSSRELPVLERPAGIPGRFDEHVKLLFDLQTLAFQADLTRVSTFMLGREMSFMAYPEIGVPDAYHALTHHQGDPVKIAKAAQINVYHAQLFSYFLEKLRSTPDGDGSLLDHSVIVYGGGLSDGNLHLPKQLPIVLVSGATDKFKGGRHLHYPEGTPLANLHLRLLDMVGVPSLEKFGDSTGNLDLLSVA